MENEVGAIHEARRWASDGHVWASACVQGVLTRIISETAAVALPKLGFFVFKCLLFVQNNLVKRQGRLTA